jgi:hypothetical protein
MLCDFSLRLMGGGLPDFAGWSGYPSIAAFLINPGIDAMGQNQTNAASAFPILDGSIEFGDKRCQVCRSPRTGFAQTLKNAYPFGTRRRAGIWESGA